MKFLATHKEQIKKDFKDCNSLEDLISLLNRVEVLHYAKNPYFTFERKEIKKKSVTFLLYSKKIKYKAFEIPKRSGGVRQIIAPNKNLKRIQRLLLFCLETLYTPYGTATGFIRGRSVVTNAKKHCGKKYVYNLDLENFFPSISFFRIWSVLYKLKQIGLQKEIARIVANLCCLNGSLPQGAPTSPFLSNLVCIKLDAMLYNFTQSQNITYSRYADDITFSSNDYVFNELFKNDIKEIITSQGFDINQKKERLQRSNVIDENGALIRERQEVTGIIVNQKPNVSKTYIRNLRATIHNWEKHGYDSASASHERYYTREKGFQRYNGQIPNIEMVVGGKLEYLGMVRGKEDSTYIDFKLRFDSLCLKDNYSNEELESILQLAKSKGLKAAIDRFYDKRNLNGNQT